MPNPFPDLVWDGEQSVEVEEAAVDTSPSPPPPSPTFSAILGSAGTGKTTLARSLLAADPRGTVLTATTGIAAVNLGDATTIHSLLGYYDTPSLVDKYTTGHLHMALRKQRAGGLRRILLDEVSMLDALQLSCIAKAVMEVNEGSDFDAAGQEAAVQRYLAEQEQDQKGGEGDRLSLVLVGDFCQLPPVKAEFAFLAPEWGWFEDHLQILSTIHRQADPDFILALQHARQGRPEKALEFFEPHLQGVTNLEYDGPTIWATNDAVDRFNGLRHSRLPGEGCVFEAQREGKPRGEWKGIPDQVWLKEGARVMVLANNHQGWEGGRSLGLLYANGDLGTFLGMTEQSGQAVVKLDRTGEEVQVGWVRRENHIPLESGRRKELKALGRSDLLAVDGKHEIVGSLTYMPLRLAYATTCHKAQGLTFDQVQINLVDRFWSTPGMLYVGLSRARSIEGLRLVGSARGFAGKCVMDPKVRRWC